jgi:hypothetical protein
MMDLSKVRQAVFDVIGTCPSIAHIQAVVRALREQADELERLTEVPIAYEQVAQPPSPESRLGGGWGKSPIPSDAACMRIKRQSGGTGAASVSLRRDIWQALGQPRRLDLRRRGTQMVLVPVKSGGYAVTVDSKGVPGFVCGAETVRLLNVNYGWSYECEIEEGAIVLGAALN